jgi:prepilin-type N-terminal cleavage/methylation domain-containing protein
MLMVVNTEKALVGLISRMLPEDRKGPRKGERGFTLVELLGTVMIIGLVTAVAVPTLTNYVDEAKLARCQANLKGLQAEVWHFTDDQQNHPDAATFWKLAHGGTKPGPWVYLVDGDANKGHGNDIDGIDEENPGKSQPDKDDIHFVIYCKHEHRHLAEWVYVTDEGEPRIVTGKDDDPGYQKFEKWEFK